MNAAPTVPRTVRCPTCGGPSAYTIENPYRPFCSKRCNNLDFGAWASEAYRVEVKPEPAGEDTESGP